MIDPPAHPPQQSDETVLPYQSKTPRLSSFGPLDFRKLAALLTLSVIAVALLCAIVHLIPHPYAGYGIDAFLIVATPAFFLLRRRYIFIASLAILITAAVIFLHVRAIRHIEIRNDSRLAINNLQIIASQGDESRSFQIASFPSGVSGRNSFLFPGFDGEEISISGTLADGRKFQYSPLAKIFAAGGSAPYRGTTLITIRADGTVDVENR